MNLTQTLLLAIIQGLTEFIPVSSSAHLLFPALLLGWPYQGLAFDVAVHLGTLIAVVTYFRSEILGILRGFVAYARNSNWNQDLDLGLKILIATLPIIVIGSLFEPVVEHHLRNLKIVAWTTLGFGLLLGIADWTRKIYKKPQSISMWIALWIGLAQVIALVPGTSRAGITITAALFLGVARTEAARFAMLLSIPTILAAGALVGWNALESKAPVDWKLVAAGTAVTAATALACIAAFLRFVDKIGMMPFVFYRVIVGVSLLWVLYAVSP